ncbi:General amino-acid permease GAP2 [Erysiphe neolycopersici]|uniref:General amino-acid permease GAP2 n=1 Tax=Erysiphe neolycopersici TaxID=212602 RepID=A0A420HFN9_9PEZI|nr:General amino-acid permease GAP2 [Erysiphe neolycopersici]
MGSQGMAAANYYIARPIRKSFLSVPKKYCQFQNARKFGSFNTELNRKYSLAVGDERRSFNAEAAAWNTANTPLRRRLKGRHIQMIAIGGSIGTGLFLESGTALAMGGPGSLLIAFLFLSVVLFCVMQALGEMAVTFPVAGSFSAFATRFIDPAWGFALGWTYGLLWTFMFPLQIISATISLEYWNSSIPGWVATTGFLLLIIIINLFNVKVYGEIEFTFSILKVTAIVGFIGSQDFSILGAIINCAGTQDSGYIGTKYWRNPGAFHNGFKGLCSVLVEATFSFTGIELMALAAAETQNPSKAFPNAIKQAFWHIAILYIITITMIGLLVPYDSPLLNHINDIDSKASPFIIAIQSAGIIGLDLAMNTVILIAVLSVANSSIYSATRTFAALAEQGQAPRVMAYVDPKGRPLVNIGLVSLFGLTAFIYETSFRHMVFNWLLTLSGVSTILTWCSICYAHIAFRRAWAYQGLHQNDLIYRSPVGISGSYFGFFSLVLILVAQFWIAISPQGNDAQRATDRAIWFFGTYSTVPVIMILFFGYKLWYRTQCVHAINVDLVTGRNTWENEFQRRAWIEERNRWPRWKVIYHSFF